MDVKSELIQRVEAQFYQWTMAQRAEKPHHSDDGSVMRVKRPVIAITREPGCHGGSIANAIAKEFGFDVFGIELVDIIAKNADLSRQMVDTLDEKTQTMLNKMFNGSIYQETYLENLKEVILAIASHGNAIILGRGASFILPQQERLAIRIVAPLEFRVKNIMERKSLSEQESREYVEELTLQRRQFTKSNFHMNIDDPVNYDLTINSSSVHDKTIIELIKILMNEKNATV
jgi:cytidylate kinase